MATSHLQLVHSNPAAKQSRPYRQHRVTAAMRHHVPTAAAVKGQTTQTRSSLLAMAALAALAPAVWILHALFATSK